MTDFSKIAAHLLKKTQEIAIDKSKLHHALDSLIDDGLFTSSSDKIKMENTLYAFHTVLMENASILLNAREAKQKVAIFMDKLPQIKKLLDEEAYVFSCNDPAANSIDEIIIAYPGFFALTVHRIAHELNRLGIPILPRLFSEYAHSKVGVDINPGATIGNAFYIDHGTGIVIGESTLIGNNVKIYQGVTLGALFVTKELSNKKRHPTIEDNVVIYAGATILGGKTVIGHDSIIGGNAWLTKSVLPYSLVQQNAEIRIRSRWDSNDPIEFYI
jgi:serine O-acetyltransferase